MNHVLVIDDDIELCGLITRFLEPEGFSVEAAYDGRINQVIEQIVRQNISWILGRHVRRSGRHRSCS